jgi:hypothetical protein
MDQNPTPKQALEILAQAAAQFRGTRAEHEILEKALRTLVPLVEPASGKEIDLLTKVQLATLGVGLLLVVCILSGC